MVKKFKYRLERVLDYRRLVKDEKMKELLLKNRKLADAEGQLGELETALLLNQLEENVEMTIHEVEMIAKYSKRLGEEIEHQKLEVVKAEEQVELARNELINATKEAGALEKHKDRKLNEHSDYLKKEEEKFLDEVVTQRAGFTKR